LEVAPLAVSPDVVCLSRSARFEHTTQASAMVLDIQPITALLAVAIYWQRFALHSVENHERYQLLRKLERPIVI